MVGIDGSSASLVHKALSALTIATKTISMTDGIW